MAAPREDFWSRRKAAVEVEAVAEAAAARAADEARAREVLALEQADKTDAEILGDLGLQDPDLMQLGDDFAAFMRSAVPEHLRRKALRRLWRSNPVLANLDGLVDHGDDFTDAATVVPDMKTTYQVGRGMLKHVLMLADAADTERPATVLADAPETKPELEAEQEEDTAELTSAALPADTTSTAWLRDDPPPAPPRHHMRFKFAD